MPVVPAKREVRKSATELPIGVMQPKPVTTTRFTTDPLAVSVPSYKSLAAEAVCGSGGGGGWRLGGVKFGDSGDHVADGFDAAEGVVGDLDVECFFDLE